MKFIYPAVFHKTEEGHYKGYFPDLECCYGEGETLDDAIESANEAARDWITLELSEDEPMIPYVSDIEDIEVKDGEERTILNKKVSFFDIGSTKAKQFGFQMIYDGGKVLTCCGDEPYNECEEKYAKGSDWMFHEAFCLYGQRDIFNPYEKHHSTVKDASELAENLGVKNLVLYHTEDKNIRKRKELYGAEGREYYHGNLFIPDDLDVIEM